MMQRNKTAKPPARKAVQELSRAQLFEMIWQRPMSAVAQDLNVSRNTLSKICDRLLIPYPMRGHRGQARNDGKSERPALLPAPEGTPELIILSKTRTTRSRRARSRMTPAARTEQILSVAAKLISEDGLTATSMKRIAAAAGISETLIYRYFPTLQSLFVQLTRRELNAVRLGQIVGSQPEDDSLEGRIYQATKNYISVIAERGGLLQILLSDPTIDAGFRREYRQDRSTIVHSLAQASVRTDGVPPAVAEAASGMSTAATMRAGRLVVQKKVSADLAFQISHTIALTTAKSVARVYGKKPQAG